MVRLLRIEELEFLQSYRFHFGDVEEDVTLLSFERETVTRALENLFDPAWLAPQRTSLAELTKLLIPKKVLGSLDQECSPILLDSRESNIPWEAVLRSACQHENLTVVRNAPQVTRKDQKANTGVSVLVAEPDILPRAGGEAEAFLTETGLIEVKHDSAEELLLNSRAGCLYLVAVTNSKGGLCLGHNSLSSAIFESAFRQARRVPRLCFLRCVQVKDGQNPSPVTAAHRAAVDFLEAGAETVIVSLWEPNPAEYQRALGLFWNSLKGAGRVGDAYRAMIESLPVSDSQRSSDAFLIYGNLELKHSDLYPTSIPSTLSVTTAPSLGKPDCRLLVTAGPEAGRQVPVFFKALVNGRPLTIGRPGVKRCDLEIEDPDTVNRVAQLEHENQELYLRNLTDDPAAVRLNGLPVIDRIHVKGWETIGFGSTLLEVRTGAGEKIERPDQKIDARFGLTVIASPESDAGSFHPLTETFTLVGRQGAFPLSDPSVSRQHCAIIERDGRHLLSPLGGSHLALNGIGISEETELSLNDQIQLSEETVLRYSNGKAAK